MGHHTKRKRRRLNSDFAQNPTEEAVKFEYLDLDLVEEMKKKRPCFESE